MSKRFEATNAEVNVADMLSGSVEDQHYLDAVSRVVAAFAARETATVDEVVDLARRLTSVFQTPRAAQPPLRPSTAAAASEATQAANPALAIENSVTTDTVFCLCCGRGFTMLKRHLKAEHGLTEQEYRLRFNLPDDFPLVAPDYSERKAAYAKQVGLGKYRRDDLAPGATAR